MYNASMSKLPISTWILSIGIIIVALLTLTPVFLPRPQIPTVTRTSLPLKTDAQTAPVYPSSQSIQPLISGRVNLNTASLEQLLALPDVGEVLANRIIKARPFRNLQDLDNVKGIGTAMLKRLTPLVTF